MNCRMRSCAAAPASSTRRDWRDQRPAERQGRRAPFCRPGAPNGIDERLTVDMVAEAKARHAQQLSLAFAAFPEIFDNTNRGLLHRVFYRLINLLDPLIALESLCRYLRKFHALGQQRYAIPAPPAVSPAGEPRSGCRNIPGQNRPTAPMARSAALVSACTPALIAGTPAKESTAGQGPIALHPRTNDPGAVRRCVPGLAQTGTGG
jgi:Phosphatidylglycerol lysyltransferase, C-terminal